MKVSDNGNELDDCGERLLSSTALPFDDCKSLIADSIALSLTDSLPILFLTLPGAELSPPPYPVEYTRMRLARLGFFGLRKAKAVWGEMRGERNSRVTFLPT